MKHLRKLTALLAVVTLLLTLWAPMAVSAAPVAQQEELLYFGRSILEKMDNSKALLYAYDKLVEGITNHEEEIDISHRTYKLDWDEAVTVQNLVLTDHPEFFYVSYVSCGGGNYVTYFAPNYWAEMEAYIGLVNHRVQVLTRGLEGKSDYEKSVILHDRVCDAVMYNLDSLHNQTAVSSLVFGESVCAGYARAYQILMQTVGIPCFYVVGTADNGAGIGGHGWNMVQLDGQWYYTDVTWDDQNDAGGPIYYSYLNVTYDQIAVDHFADEYAAYLPHSTATANNFFVKNGLCLDVDTVIDIQALAKVMPTISSLQFYCPSHNSRDLIDRVFSIAYKVGFAITGDYGLFSVDGLGLLGDVLVVDLVFLHEHTYETDTTPACECAVGTVVNHCTTCGYTEKTKLPAVGHESHWLWDETQHWTSCDHCGVVNQQEKHVMEKGVCIACGYTVAVAVNYGDVNGDSEINNRDLVLIQQYLNGWKVTVDADACDCNADGEINNRDLVLLQQYLNGWNVTLG